MKFFFPDSSDLVDPSFDFEHETRSATRVRQRDDQYAHEVFDAPPFDGILVSKAIVEGYGGAGARYTLAQRHRLLREGVRSYFRLERRDGGSPLQALGDCGAFSYVREKRPPFTTESVLDFYTTCGFDLGLSVDHVILGYDAALDGGLPAVNVPPPEWKDRQATTLELADEFLRLHKKQNHRFTPIGVVQGWSPASYAGAVSALQRMGYRYIAIGGIVPLKTAEILALLEAVAGVRRKQTRLHLLGVTRTEEVGRFARYGVVSFDSTSPLRQAFKDDKENFYTLDRAYPAVRVPQVQGNPKLQTRIAAGEIDHETARKLETRCLDALRRYDQEMARLDEVLDLLGRYQELYGSNFDRTEAYREVLSDRPWRECSCNVCKTLGIHVILFRGAERNRRRGFHNLHVFYQRLHRDIALGNA